MLYYLSQRRVLYNYVCYCVYRKFRIPCGIGLYGWIKEVLVLNNSCSALFNTVSTSARFSDGFSDRGVGVITLKQAQKPCGV